MSINGSVPPFQELAITFKATRMGWQTDADEFPIRLSVKPALRSIASMEMGTCY